MKLGELLLQYNVVTVTQLQQALQSQKMYGGKLGSHLIEMGLLTHVQLSDFLTKQLSLPAATPKDFENIPPEIASLVTKEFAAKHKLMPICWDKHKVRVAFSDPLDLKAREEAAFMIGKPVIPMVAPESLIQYALSKYYQICEESRYIQIMDDSGFNNIEITNGEAAINGEFVHSSLADVASSEAEISREHLIEQTGGFTAAELARALANARNKEDIFRSLFRFLEPLFSVMIVFIARKDEVWGWMQQGLRLHEAQLRRRLLNIDQESSISEVFRKKDVVLDVLFTSTDLEILNKLGAENGLSYQIFPMLLSGKVVAAFLATTGTAMPPPQVERQVSVIQKCLTKGSIALQMINLRRKILGNA